MVVREPGGEHLRKTAAKYEAAGVWNGGVSQRAEEDQLGAGPLKFCQTFRIIK